MTFKELEWKKIKELISPYVEFKLQDDLIIGRSKCYTNGLSKFHYTLFTYFSEHKMCVHFITDYNELTWDYEPCKNYFDVLRLLPKIKETFLEIKFPGYHDKLKRIQNDF